MIPASLTPASIRKFSGHRRTLLRLGGSLSIFGLTLFFALRAQAATFTWDGNGGVGLSNWSTVGNWTAAGVPTQPGTGLDDIQFAGTIKLTPNMQASYNINSLTFNNGAGLFVLSNTAATTLTIQGGGIVNNDNSIQTINISDITLGAAQSWNAGAVAGGSLAVNSAVNLNGNLLSVTGTNDTSIGGIISGAAGLTKLGTGTLTLSMANAYTGVTTVSAGTLIIGANAPSGSAGALGNAVSEVVLGVAGGGSDASILTGGAFTVDRIIRIPTTNTTDVGTRVLTLGGNTADNSVFSGNIFLGTTNQAGRGVTLTAASGGQVTFSGVIQDPSGMDATAYTVTKSGLGTVVFSNANTYTGATNVSAGTLALSGSGTLGAVSGNVTVSGGTLDLGGLTPATRTGTVSLTSGTITNGTLNKSGANFDMQSGTASAVLGGAVGLDKTTAGSVTLSGANTYTGVTTVSAGTLIIGANAPSGSAGALGNASSEVVLGVAGGNSDASILTGGAFTVDRIIRIPTSNTTDSGTRVLTLGGNTADNSVFSGNIFLGTTNQAGRGVTLTAASGGQVTFSGVIQNPTGMDATTYTVTKSGLGTVIFSGANTYTGNTTVSAGTLALSGSGTLGAVSGNITVSGGTLDLGGLTPTTRTGAVSLTGGTISNGTLNKSGANFDMQSGTASAVLGGAVGLDKTTAGSVTLSGANTYTGVTTVSAGTLIIGANAPSGSAGALGNASSEVVLGVAGGNSDASILIGGAFTVDRIIRTPTTNTTDTGTRVLTLGGNTADNSVFSGNIFLGTTNQAGRGVTVTAASGGQVTFSGVIQNPTGMDATAYTVTKSGLGTVIFSGANTYTGNTTVGAGTLRATTSANALGSGTLTMSGGTLELANNTGLAFNRNTTVSSSSTITSDVLTPGAAGVTHTLGTLLIGTQTLTIGVGANVGSGTAGITFGAVTLNTGDPTFTVASGALLTMGSITSGGGGDRTITFGGTGNTTVSGVIDDASGGGNTTFVTKTGNGTLTLANANTYADVTTISGGIVKVQNNTSLGTTGGGTTVASGAAIQIDGSGLTVAEAITSLAGDGGGLGALRNLANNNTWSGVITVADTGAKIFSDSGLLTLSGGINEAGASLKTLTLGGRGDIAVTTAITADAGDLAVTKDGSGTLTLSAVNTYDGVTTVKSGTMVLSGANGTITASTGITINSGGTLQLDNTTINTNRIGTVTVTMNGGTLNFSNPATLGGNYTEATGQLTLSSGSSTIRTDVANTGASSSSILTFSSLSRAAGSGATVNFGGGTGNPSSANDNNNVRFTAQAAGLIGPWATVGGTSYATYVTAGSASVEALATYNQTVTRLSSGTKSIANVSTDNVQITDGTGTAADITLGSVTTVINTLTNSATGTNAPAGNITIDPAGRTLRVAGILNATGSGALLIGNGTNNGTLTAASAGGELIIQNFSTNSIIVNSVIANNTSASALTVGGSGTTIVTASNTYTGTTTISGGTLQIGNAGTTGSLSTSSAIVTNATLAFNRTNTVTQGTDFNSVISGTGGVTQFGSGTLVLNGTNTYSGVTTFEAGIVNVANLTNYGVSGSLGNRLASEETVTGVGLYFSGGTLQYTGSTAQSTDRSIRVDITTNGGATIDASGSNSAATMNFTSSIPNADPWANPGSRTITLTGSNTGDNTFAINIQEYTDGAGSHTNLIKSGAGTWDLTNTHNSDAPTNSYNTYGGYGGGTTISGGTLGFTNGAIGGGVIDITGNATLRWDTGNTQDISTGTGAGFARSVKIEDGVTATFNTNGNNVTLSNAFTLGASGTAAVTKSGTGTLTLTAANSYTGATTISASGGTLEVGQGGSLTATSGITVNSGGTLLLSGTTNYNRINDSAAVTLAGGTFAMGGSASFDEQVGALTLSASSTIDFGTLAGGNILRFADSTGATWGAFTLSIWNWTEGADHLYFGSVFGAGLPVGGLGKILFYTDSGTTPTGGAPAGFGPANGEVSPVPEPSAVLIGLSLLSLAGYRERRWLFRCREARRNAKV